MTRDDIRARRDESIAFFDAAIKIASIVEALSAGPLAEYDAEIVARRVTELVTDAEGNDSETGEPITGPTP